MTKERLYLFDTTLRDGAQTTGVDFSIADKRRIMGAIYATPDISWFFKMVGEDGLVRAAEKDFLKLLESLKGL